MQLSIFLTKLIIYLKFYDFVEKHIFLGSVTHVYSGNIFHSILIDGKYYTQLQWEYEFEKGKKYNIPQSTFPVANGKYVAQDYGHKLDADKYNHAIMIINISKAK